MAINCKENESLVVREEVGDKMAIVKAKPGDTVDRVIRKFTKKVIDEGIIEEAKKREFYQKPSEIKKEKLKELKKRLRKRR